MKLVAQTLRIGDNSSTDSTTSTEEEEESGPAQSSLAMRKHASFASESQPPVVEQSFEESTHLTLASMKLVAQTLRIGDTAGATASSAATASATSGQYSTGMLQQSCPLGQSPFTHSA